MAYDDSSRPSYSEGTLGTHPYEASLGRSLPWQLFALVYSFIDSCNSPCLSCLLEVCWPSRRRSGPQDDPLDLAATIIHPDDLDWIVAEQELQGQLDDAPYITDVSLHLTTVDEVLASPWYLWGRGGFLPSASGSVDLSDLLQESGWVRTMDAFMVRLANIEDSWLTGVGVSIEEYESSEGAEQAFAAFNDEQTLRRNRSGRRC